MFHFHFNTFFVRKEEDVTIADAFVNNNNHKNNNNNNGDVEGVLVPVSSASVHPPHPFAVVKDKIHKRKTSNPEPPDKHALQNQVSIYRCVLLTTA